MSYSHIRQLVRRSNHDTFLGPRSDYTDYAQVAADLPERVFATPHLPFASCTTAGLSIHRSSMALRVILSAGGDCQSVLAEIGDTGVGSAVRRHEFDS